ncbi:hypothetical protein LMG28688_00232 [Paraburkholderia caffeinitolerans]|uniref:Sulfotransferase domain-containing protein n=1 Tax=Paraburkholderia caffeinitolerans TaxID=1723730 RepID=A0A6J5FAY3_9BURK|nr:hypothetical protein [Paraburkholderia caffeinitolerans]CAB3776438.1 hypothetical protein LMG28688_00232 [Paraburkholderia caffeinitolerans]
MKKIIIHIGSEKCGSTSLQNFFFENELALVQHGFSYFCDPEKSYFYVSRDGHQKGHFPVVASLCAQKPDYLIEDKVASYAKVLGDLIADARISDKHIILSAEHFSSRLRALESLEILRDALNDFDVKIVLYVRPQHEMLVSSYNAGVRAGRRSSFGFDEGIKFDPYFNYYELVKPWADVFGRERIVIRDWLQLKYGDVRKDFVLSVLNLESTHGFVFGKNNNKSLNVPHLEAIRLMNHHLPMFDECKSGEEWDRTSAARRIVSDVEGLSGPALAEIMSDQQLIDLWELFRESNALLEDEYMTRGALAGWQPLGRVRSANEDRPDRADMAIIAAQLAKLCAQFEYDVYIARQELNSVYGSASWRATAVLRHVNRALQRLFG